MACSNLPVHPSQRHPLTGEPLRALWVRPDGRIMWPIMGGDETADAAAQGAQAAQAAADAAASKAAADAAAKGSGDPKYPANTPPDQMTVDQRAAFYYDQSQKWEGRATKNYATLRDLGISSPEDAAAIKDKVTKQEALELELGTATEKAVAETKKTVQAEADGKYQPLLVKAEFRAAAAGRIEPEKLATILEPLDLSRFLNDSGDVDTAKVSAYVDGVAPAKGSQQRGPAIPRGTASPGGSGAGLTGLSGSDLYDRIHPKKTA